MALQERLGRNKTILANFFLSEFAAGIRYSISIAYLSLLASGYRLGIVWRDHIRSIYNKLCIAGDQLRVQYVRSEERGDLQAG